MNRKKLYKITTDKIVGSLALFCVGICLIIWAEEATDIIAIILGGFALLYSILGLARFITASPRERRSLSLFFIILSFIIGILLILRTDFIKGAISFIIGFYIILTSATAIVDLYDSRQKLGLKLGSYIWPVIGLLVGILCVSGQFIVPDQLARLTGAVLVVYAVAWFIGLLMVSKNIKEAKSSPSKEAPAIKEGKVVKPKSSKNSSKSSKKSKK